MELGTTLYHIKQSCHRLWKYLIKNFKVGVNYKYEEERRNLL